MLNAVCGYFEVSSNVSTFLKSDKFENLRSGHRDRKNILNSNISEMLRQIVRSFRQLPVVLPDLPVFQENVEIQLSAIKELNEAEEISRAGGSEKAHALHASRNKVFGT